MLKDKRRWSFKSKSELSLVDAKHQSRETSYVTVRVYLSFETEKPIFRYKVCPKDRSRQRPAIFSVDCSPGPLKIDQMYGKAEAHNWGQMSDGDLESAARYYLWLVRAFPDLPSHRLDEIITEANRRGKPEILSHAKASIQDEA